MKNALDNKRRSALTKKSGQFFPNLLYLTSDKRSTRARTGDAPTPTKKRERERERERERRGAERYNTSFFFFSLSLSLSVLLYQSIKTQHHVVSFVQTRHGRRFRQSLRRDPVPARETTREIANPRRRRLLVQDGKDRLRGRRTVGETPEMEKIRTKTEKVQDAPRGEL